MPSRETLTDLRNEAKFWLIYSALERPHLESALGSPAEEGHGPSRAGLEEAMKIIRGLKHLPYEDRLRELGLYSLEKRGLWGDLVVAFQYLKGTYRKAGEGLFIRECSERMRGNCFKLKEGRFRLDIKG